MIADMQRGAAALGFQLEIPYASTSSELEASLAGVVQKQAAGLMITPGSLFLDQLTQIVTLALHEGVPATFANRRFPEAGGLMSYGSNWTDTFHQAGIYCGRILKGAKPADLPVQQATRFDFIINLKTAKALGLTARGDEGTASYLNFTMRTSRLT